MEEETFFAKLIQERGYAALLLLLYVLGLGVSGLLFVMHRFIPGFDTTCSEIGNQCLFLYQIILILESHVGALAAYMLGWDIAAPSTILYMVLITTVFYIFVGRMLDRPRG